jgi:hypothetical protein
MNVYLSLAEKTGLLQGIPYLHPLLAKHSLNLLHAKRNNCN